MVNRRTFLKTTGVAAGTAALGFPAVLRAQPKEIKIGAVHPVTGPLAEIGQACRLGPRWPWTRSTPPAASSPWAGPS